MIKKLKIRFVRFERAFSMQILEQKGEFKSTEHVLVEDSPYLLKGAIFLRGVDRSLDLSVCGTHILSSNKARDQYLEQIIRWISKEQFSSDGKLEIGKNCEVSDDGEVWLARWKYVKPLYGALKIDGDIYTWEMEVSE